MSRVFGSSGKGSGNRTAIYPVYVFPNVTPWPSRTFRDASSQQESTP